MAKIGGRDQDQHVAEGGTAVQAGGNITILQSGLSVADVRTVALGVFRENFQVLQGIAAETARARAEEMTEAYLTKLLAENPNGLDQANNPDFQYALFAAQREYARSGDKDLGDLLVDLLVDRSKHDQRDILQIVLNESISTAPKLTENQLAVLAVLFLFKYTQNFGVGNLEQLGGYLDLQVQPFAGLLVKNAACYQHLEFAGCGATGLGQIMLEGILADTYQGLFCLGFSAEEIANQEISIGADPRFFIPCLNDQSKLQVNAINKDRLEKTLEALQVPVDDRPKIVRLFDSALMTHETIREKCVALRPYMASVFQAWSESEMKSFTLTSVGIAIGHANIKRLVGEFANLSIWIN